MEIAFIDYSDYDFVYCAFVNEKAIILNNSLLSQLSGSGLVVKLTGEILTGSYLSWLPRQQAAYTGYKNFENVINRW